MTTTAPKRGCFGRSILTVIIALIIGAVVCVGIVVVVAGPAISNLVNTLAAPLTVSQDFMTALVAKDYTKAYGLVHPSQKESFGGSAEGMQQVLSDNALEPSSFSFTNVQIIGDAIVNGTGTFGRENKYIYISLRKDGDNWKIIGLEANNDAPTATPAS